MTDREKQLIARIDTLSALARTSWLGLLAYLAYVGITLLAVEDADFFVPSRQTQLPLVGISIPTLSFFIFAPPLAAALYIYLHIHLLKLWDALATAPARIDGEALGDLIHPWLANDLFLTLRGNGAVSTRPLRGLSNLATRLLVWAAGPLVLAGFWFRSMPAHDERLTLFLALCLLISLYAGLAGWWSALSAARYPFLRPWPNPWAGWWKRPLGLATVVFVVAASWLSTEFDLTLDKETPVIGRWMGDVSFSTLVPANLAGVAMVPMPADWRTPETARHTFRQTWCGREGLAMPVCGHSVDPIEPPSAALTVERRIWCTSHDLPADGDCNAHFTDLDRRFDAAWTEERVTGTGNLAKLDLTTRDLRRANAARVSLVAANLSGARLEAADLFGARLEGADLSLARLEWANLWQARLEGANLFLARLEGADLSEARLEGADLRGRGWRGRTSRGRGWKGRTSRGRGWKRHFFRGRGWKGLSLGGAAGGGGPLGGQFQIRELGRCIKPGVTGSVCGFSRRSRPDASPARRFDRQPRNPAARHAGPRHRTAVPCLDLLGQTARRLRRSGRAIRVYQRRCRRDDPRRVSLPRGRGKEEERYALPS